ncbi:MAG: hypothetical protein B7W98_02145 [Parcubacteria group bacterium 20-58-5]|nr:MAG: hypothetical protein B7W98_02145 [Parcubacteria group bacterium 20-58-5]
MFLNFSLFISEAIIDTGNLFATQFFTQINGGTLPTPTGTGITGLASNGVNLTTGNEGISNRIMGQLGLQNIYGAALTNTKILEGGYSWIVGFMGIILFIVAAFVMFSLAFVLIARFIALVFLLVVAPVGFAGLAIPGFAARAKDWWTQLFHQTITAPILLLMLYIALAVITDVKFLTGFGVTGGSSAATGFWDGFVQNTTGASNLAGFASMLLSFLVAMGLLIAVVVYAKRWSAFGGDWATKTAAKLSFGLTAAGMRTTVGWGSQRLSQAWRHTPLSRAPILGRAVSGALDRGAKGSFDLRGTGALKAIPFGSNIAAGTAQKGGFRDWEKGKIKEREEYAKTLEQTSGTILGHKFFEGEKEDQEIAEGRLRVSKAAYEAEKTEDNKRVMEEAKDEVERLKRAPQAGYAKGLRLGLDKGNFINRVINPQRNTKAADNIIKEATKSKIDKDFDSLKKLLEEKAKEKETEEKKSEAPKP